MPGARVSNCHHALLHIMVDPQYPLANLSIITLTRYDILDFFEVECYAFFLVFKVKLQAMSPVCLSVSHTVIADDAST